MTYEKNFSEEELGEIIKYHSSKVGKLESELAPHVSKLMNQIVEKYMSANSEQLQKNIEQILKNRMTPECKQMMNTYDKNISK